MDLPSAEYRLRSDLYQRDITDATGHFTLRGLNPGKYSVLAFEELTEDPRNPNFIKSYQSQSETMQLEDSSKKSATLRLIPATD